MKEFDRAKGKTAVSFTGTLDGVTSQNLRDFQTFMHLMLKVDGEPDYITMNSLMSSAGNTNRYCFGVDTAKQLTEENIQALVQDKVNYVGRYLTGTYGVGANKKAKNLTRQEAEAIINAHLGLVPIYQDNTGDVSDYSYDSGIHDATEAVKAPLALGIPDGHTIYFAVDTDMTEDENEAHAIPYFTAIAKVMSHYTIGVYGTRNTCSMVSKAVPAVKYAYVSNMSTGFSGNLGFSQPLNWAFDQFDETGPEGNLPGRDKVAVSELDKGVNELVASRKSGNWVEDSDWTVMKDLIATHKIEYNGKPYVLVDDATLKVSVSYKNITTLNPDTPVSFTYLIKNGKIDSSIETELAKDGITLGGDLGKTLNKFTAGLESGFVTFNIEIEKGSAYPAKISIEFSDKELKDQNGGSTNEDVVVFDVEFKWDNMKDQLLKAIATPANAFVKEAAQSMLTLINGVFNTSKQLIVALLGAVTAVLHEENQLDSRLVAAVTTATDVLVVGGVIYLAVYFLFPLLAGVLVIV